MTGCPSEDLLSRYLSGGLTSEQQSGIDQHLSSCQRCTSLLERQAMGSRASQWRKAAGDTPPVQAIRFPPSQRHGYLGRLLEFEIETALSDGEGGMGTVYRALDTRINRWVALKLIKPGLAGISVYRSMFEREAQAMGRVASPYIVPIHRVVPGIKGFDIPFLVMELVEGRSLRAELAQRTTLEAGKAAAIVRHVAAGLSAIHAAGLIHRDIKPENILLDRRNKRARVADFGLARPTDPEALALTLPADRPGTPAYMSPEQIDGEGPLDGRSDVFSLGVVLYEMLAGVRPFGGEFSRPNQPDALPVSPRKYDRAIPADLATICLHCLDGDPEHRYAGAEALAEDLDAFLHHRPIKARPPGAGRYLVLFARRNRALMALAASFLVVASLGSGVAYRLIRAEKEQNVELGKTVETATKTAKQASLRADEADKTAVAAKKTAAEKSHLAEEKSKLADERAVNERRTRYLTDFKAAWKAWENNRPKEARALLDAHLPREQAAGADFRGFEWFYLDRLLKESYRFLTQDFDARGVCFSPDGKRLAVLGSDRGQRSVTLFSLPGGTRERALELGIPDHANGRIERSFRESVLHSEQGVSFSPDGRWVAGTAILEVSGSRPRDGVVRVWEAESGALVFQKHDAAIAGRCVAFSPDGQYLLAGGYDHAALVWGLPDGELRWTLPAFERTGREIAQRAQQIPRPVTGGTTSEPVVTLRFERSGSSAPDLVRWCGKAGVKSAFPPAVPRMGRALQFETPLRVESVTGPRGMWAVGRGGTLSEVRMLPPPRPAREVNSEPPATAGLSIGPDSLRAAVATDAEVALAGGDGVVTVAEPPVNDQAFRRVRTLMGYPPGNPGILSLAFSPDRTRLAAAGSGGVIVWDVTLDPTWLPLREILDPVPRTSPPPLSPPFKDAAVRASDAEGRWSAFARRAAHSDGVIHVYDAQTREWRTFTGHEEGVLSLAFQPKGTLLASSAIDGTVRLWERAGGQQVRVLEGHLEGVGAHGYSPDGNRWLGGADHYQRCSISALAFSPDGRWLASGDEAGRVMLWDMEHDQPAARFQGRRAWAFHGDLFAVPDEGKEIVIWSLSRRETVRRVDIGGVKPSSLAFLGETRLLSSGGGIARLWSIESGLGVMDFPLPWRADRLDTLGEKLNALLDRWRKEAAGKR